MADKPAPSNPFHVLLWLLGILAFIFFLWVRAGGPEKAREKNLGPVINGPVGGQSSNTQTTTSTQTNTGTSGQINVIPVQ